MKTTIHCDERITNIRHTIYVKLFWGIIIANELTYLLDYFFKTSLRSVVKKSFTAVAVGSLQASSVPSPCRP